VAVAIHGKFCKVVKISSFVPIICMYNTGLNDFLTSDTPPVWFTSRTQNFYDAWSISGYAGT
jgi:hypothetical protein